MFAKWIDEFAEKVITNGFADDDEPLIGCTENEIAEIESKCGCKLPDVYRAFLLKMGRSSGEFMRDYYHTYPWLLTSSKGVQDELNYTSSSITMSPTAFAFWFSESGAFLFFDTAAGDDPPVFLVEGNCEQPVQKHDHFSDFLVYWLDAEITSRDELLKRG